jgi:hypothetical protein
MSEALLSYFSNLALERDTECENLTVVVDNAHIPLYDFVGDPVRAFSQSLSAINTVSFPPAFLKETSRWESIEGSSNSDFSLSVPSRSRDDLDAGFSPRSHLQPTSSLNSTARFLRDLPLESPNNGRRRKEQFLTSPARRMDDDLPLLKSPYEEVDTHPIVTLRRLSEENSMDAFDSHINLEELSESGDDAEMDESEQQRGCLSSGGGW